MSFQLVSKAYAQADDGKFNLGNQLVLENGSRVSEVYSNPAVLVNLIVSNLFIIAGIVLMFMFMLAGFKFLQDSSKGKEEAVKILKNSLIGFLVMFSAYWIVQIIQLITGAKIL